MSRLVSLSKAAAHLKVSEKTVRNYIGRGFFPAYRLRNVRGVVVDLDEVTRSMALIPARRARGGRPQYGPRARIVDLRQSAVQYADGTPMTAPADSENS